MDAAIKEVVGDNNFIEFDKDPENNMHTIYNAEFVLSFLEKHPNFRGLSCHSFVPTVHKSKLILCLPIVFLRHPLLRFSSVYRYEQKSDDHRYSESGILAASADFATWLNYYLDTYNGCNYQTAYFSRLENGEFNEKYTEIRDHLADIKLATERLDEIDSLIGIGIVENYKVSAAKIENEIKKYYPEFLLLNKLLNSTKQPPDWKAELEYLESQLPRKVLQKYYEKNASDIALYKRYFL